MLDGITGIIPISIKGLTQLDIDKIKGFLHGAVHSWYKTHNTGDTFSFNTFMNDAKDDCWKSTPLIMLFNVFNNNAQIPPNTINPAMKKAAKKGGLLLKSVLQEIQFNFTTVPNSSPKEYKK